MPLCIHVHVLQMLVTIIVTRPIDLLCKEDSADQPLQGAKKTKETTSEPAKKPEKVKASRGDFQWSKCCKLNVIIGHVPSCPKSKPLIPSLHQDINFYDQNHRNQRFPKFSGDRRRAEWVHWSRGARVWDSLRCQLQQPLHQGWRRSRGQLKMMRCIAVHIGSNVWGFSHNWPFYLQEEQLMALVQRSWEPKCSMFSRGFISTPFLGSLFESPRKSNSGWDSPCKLTTACACQGDDADDADDADVAEAPVKEIAKPRGRKEAPRAPPGRMVVNRWELRTVTLDRVCLTKSRSTSIQEQSRINQSEDVSGV